jgi:hypothetical protein
MDKETLSNYGWIIILVLILAVLLALASPFGLFISDAIKGATGGFWDVNSKALNTAGIDTGNVGFPAKCGIKGHYQGDGKEHEVAVTECNSGHTYTCECENGWKIPDGGKYYIGVTNRYLNNYSGATKTYNEGEKLPCGYVPVDGDIFVLGDYEYRYNYYPNSSPKYWYDFDKTLQNGWGVAVLDDTKTTYGEILESIASKPITSVSGTFMNCTNLTTSPKIPNSVKLMDSTYSKCRKLSTTPQLPNSVVSMVGTFSSCLSLNTVPVIPDGVTNINGIFNTCQGLRTYEGSTDLIGDFSNYKIPNSVKSMAYAFKWCYSLTKAPAIPSNVTNLDHAFEYCTTLTTPPDMSNATSVTSMESTFSKCYGLTSASVIPNSVTNMTYTFDECWNLTTPPIIPNSVTNMYGTFNACTKLKTAPAIPSSVINMEGTFQSCSSLSAPPDMSNATSVTNMDSTFSSCRNLKTAPAIPSGVTNMKSTFANSKITTAPVIPKSVTNMEYTFNGCHSLTGTIEINANPSSYNNCFYNVDFSSQNLTLTGASTKLDSIGATGKNYCNTCNGCCFGTH